MFKLCANHNPEKSSLRSITAFIDIFYAIYELPQVYRSKGKFIIVAKREIIAQLQQNTMLWSGFLKVNVS